MKVLRWFGYTLLSVALLIALLLFGTRFADGPIEILAGGPFTSGEIVTGQEPDWSFVRDTPTIEFQLTEGIGASKRASGNFLRQG